MRGWYQAKSEDFFAGRKEMETVQWSHEPENGTGVRDCRGGCRAIRSHGHSLARPIARSSFRSLCAATRSLVHSLARPLARSSDRSPKRDT